MACKHSFPTVFGQILWLPMPNTTVRSFRCLTGLQLTPWVSRLCYTCNRMKVGQASDKVVLMFRWHCTVHKTWAPAPFSYHKHIWHWMSEHIYIERSDTGWVNRYRSDTGWVNRYRSDTGWVNRYRSDTGWVNRYLTLDEWTDIWVWTDIGLALDEWTDVWH